MHTTTKFHPPSVPPPTHTFVCRHSVLASWLGSYGFAGYSSLLGLAGYRLHFVLTLWLATALLRWRLRSLTACQCIRCNCHAHKRQVAPSFAPSPLPLPCRLFVPALW
jgi:hypothetical protein